VRVCVRACVPLYEVSHTELCVRAWVRACVPLYEVSTQSLAYLTTLKNLYSSFCGLQKQRLCHQARGQQAGTQVRITGSDASEENRQ